MSRQPSNFDTTVAHRVMDFVSDHERQAERWVFEESVPRLGYDYVEFLSDEVGNVDQAFLGFPPLGDYFITMHLKDAGREPGKPLPFVAVTLSRGELSITDNSESMARIVEDYHHHEQVFSYAANVFLDKLTDLEQAGIMVRAGDRKHGLID
jgi:hypothetical protein